MQNSSFFNEFYDDLGVIENLKKKLKKEINYKTMPTIVKVGGNMTQLVIVVVEVNIHPHS